MRRPVELDSGTFSSWRCWGAAGCSAHSAESGGVCSRPHPIPKEASLGQRIGHTYSWGLQVQNNARTQAAHLWAPLHRLPLMPLPPCVQGSAPWGRGGEQSLGSHPGKGELFCCSVLDCSNSCEPFPSFIFKQLKLQLDIIIVIPPHRI